MSFLCGQHFAESDRIPPQETPAEAGSAGKPDETFFDDREKWTDADTAPVPARVFQKRSLGIDETLSSRIKSPRVPRIRSHLIYYVVRIGRDTLEAAIKEAVSQKELHPRLSEWEPEWSRITNASQDAAAALARLFRAIDPDGKDAEHFVRFIRQSRAGGVGASKAMRDARLLVAAAQDLEAWAMSLPDIHDVAPDTVAKRLVVTET